jgi:hypothetical protein
MRHARGRGCIVERHHSLCRSPAWLNCRPWHVCVPVVAVNVDEAGHCLRCAKRTKFKVQDSNGTDLGPGLPKPFVPGSESGAGSEPNGTDLRLVIPAQAGIQFLCYFRIVRIPEFYASIGPALIRLLDAKAPLDLPRREPRGSRQRLPSPRCKIDRGR